MIVSPGTKICSTEAILDCCRYNINNSLADGLMILRKFHMPRSATVSLHLRTPHTYGIGFMNVFFSLRSLKL